MIRMCARSFAGVLLTVVCAATASAQTLEVYAGGADILDAPATSVATSPRGLAYGPDGRMYISDGTGRLLRFDTVQGTLTSLPSSFPRPDLNVVKGDALAFNPQGQLFAFGGRNLFQVDPIAETMVYLANMGEEDLDGIAFGSDGTLYYPRMGRNQIWKRAPNGVTSLFAGTGSQGYGGDGTTVPTFFWPQAVAVDAAQNIYVSEWMNRLNSQVHPRYRALVDDRRARAGHQL